ncbi:antibiotic biosynthesis monooxygenase [Rubrivivax albus]|uniref:Antibiotic biosynthesis monooxygenase n=1 Tax=Rubrivivax albus TaxID=2499835 RepID=A0A3S2VWJ3_9BURK|nr:antibiotic biosynthesis monooxygenase [Rubrivivax albus]RVT50920.1 antibiotic biosynthesis monooxygenase [Rubrivivax albus]
MNDAPEPVTVLIRRRVKPGREADYEAWLHRLQAAARGLPGYLGVTTQRPASGAPREYLSAVRFATLADLRAFEASDLRRQALAEVAPLVDGDAAWEELTGLEFWFSAPAGTVVPQPSRPRMALVMIAVVFGLVLSIGSVVNAAFALLPVATPYPLRLLVTISLEVVLMTWWLMPWLSRRLAPWIYPQRRVA